MMLLTVSPTAADASETLSSVTFVSRLRGLELGPAHAGSRSVRGAAEDAEARANAAGVPVDTTLSDGAAAEECQRLRRLVADLQVCSITLWDSARLDVTCTDMVAKDCAYLWSCVSDVQASFLQGKLAATSGAATTEAGAERGKGGHGDVGTKKRVSGGTGGGKTAALAAEISQESDAGLGCVTESDKGEDDTQEDMCTINDGLPSREPQIHSGGVSSGAPASVDSSGDAATTATAVPPVAPESGRMAAPSKRRRSARLAAVAAAAASARARAERESAPAWPAVAEDPAEDAVEDLGSGGFAPPPIEEESSAYLDAEDLDDYVAGENSDDSPPAASTTAGDVAADQPVAAAETAPAAATVKADEGEGHPKRVSRVGAVFERTRRPSTTGGGNESGKKPRKQTEAMMNSVELIALIKADGDAEGPVTQELSLPKMPAAMQRRSANYRRGQGVAAGVEGFRDSAELAEFLADDEDEAGGIALTPGGVACPPSFGWQTACGPGMLPGIGEDSGEDNGSTPPTSGAVKAGQEAEGMDVDGADVFEEPEGDAGSRRASDLFEGPVVGAESRRASDRFEGHSVATYATVESSFSDLTEVLTVASGKQSNLPVEKADATSAGLSGLAPPPPPQPQPASNGKRPAALAAAAGRGNTTDCEDEGSGQALVEAHTARSSFADADRLPEDRGGAAEEAPSVVDGPVPEPDGVPPLAEHEQTDEAGGARTSRKRRSAREREVLERWQTGGTSRAASAPLAILAMRDSADDVAETPAAKTPKTAHKGASRVETCMCCHCEIGLWGPCMCLMMLVLQSPATPSTAWCALRTRNRAL